MKDKTKLKRKEFNKLKCSKCDWLKKANEERYFCPFKKCIKA